MDTPEEARQVIGENRLAVILAVEVDPLGNWRRPQDLEELMARGILIDLDHISEKTLDAALEMAEAVDYPVMCSHTWFRDLLYSGDVGVDEAGWDELYGTKDVHKVAHEAGKRADPIEKVARLGGIVAPIINQGDLAALKRGLAKYRADTGGAGAALPQCIRLYRHVRKGGGAGCRTGARTAGGRARAERDAGAPADTGAEASAAA